jgi:hypothetical protein
MYTLHPNDGSDVSAVYVLKNAEKNYIVQLFLFKPRAGTECQALADARACIAKANPATIIFTQGPYQPSNRPDLRGFKAIYRGKIGAGGEATVLHYYDLGEWAVKLVTIIQSTDGKSMVSIDELKWADAFIDTLAWDRLVPVGTVCKGQACDTASAYPLQDFTLASIVRIAVTTDKELPQSEKELLKTMAPVAEIPAILSKPIKLFTMPRTEENRPLKPGEKKQLTHLVYRAPTNLGEVRLYTLAIGDLTKLQTDLATHMSWQGPISFVSLHGTAGPLPIKMFDRIPSQIEMEVLLKNFMLDRIAPVSNFPLLADTLDPAPLPMN